MSRAALGVAVVLLVHASHNPVRAQADSTLLRRVDSVLAPWCHDDTPGCALGVDRDGAPLLRQAVGMASLDGALAAADAAPQPAALEPSRLAALAGVYRSPRTEEVMVLSVRDGRLFDGGTRLLPIAADRFRFSTGNATLMVPVPAGGAPSQLRIESPGARAVEYVRMSPPRLDADRLASYAGWYRSPELGAEFRLTVARDTLRLLRSWRPSLALVPLYDDGFRLDGSNRLRFLRGADGTITGLVIWAGRVRHLRFDRQPAGEDSGARSR
jgi:hypothetical protein